jgi:hypothetical protein
MKKLPLFAILIALAACTTIGGYSKITYTPEVRRQSVTTDTLFHDVLTSMNGVEHLDKVSYPNAKERTLVKIEVVFPYDIKKLGSERWTVRHDANQLAVYQVTLVPNGEGTTDFTVSKAQ